MPPKRESIDVSSPTESTRERRKSKTPPKKPPVPALPPPPDGGWGWMVVVSSFMVSVLVDGVCFSAGIFFNPFRNYFGTTKAETAWVGSVLNGSYLTVGPLVSACVNRYGCRPVAMFGSVFAGTAFFISTFSPSMPMLIVTYGLLGGVGFGFVYLPAIVMVGYYFERRRALATGIACCGSGIGAFMFAPLCNYLLEVYDWKGATWILSGLVLNALVFSVFYRPLHHPNVTLTDKVKVVENGSDPATTGSADAKKWVKGDSSAEQTRALLGGDNADEDVEMREVKGKEKDAALSSSAGDHGERDRPRTPSPSANPEGDSAVLVSETSPANNKTSPSSTANNKKSLSATTTAAASTADSKTVAENILSEQKNSNPSVVALDDSKQSSETAVSKPSVPSILIANDSKESSEDTPSDNKKAPIPSIVLQGDSSENVSDAEKLLDGLLEKNGNAKSKISDLIQTVTPEIHSVQSEESKAFMSDFQLKESNPIARMAFSQDVFGQNHLKKRQPHRHHHNKHHHHGHSHNSSHHPHHLDVENPLQRRDIFYSGSLRHIPEFQSSHSLAEYRQKITVPTCEDSEEEEEEGGEEEGDEESIVSRRRSFFQRMVVDPLKTVFDVSLLKSPTFVIYGLSCLLCMLGFFVPFIYLPTLCIDLGISASKAAFLISIIGIANTISRVVVGFVSDQPWADCLIINNVALIIGGIATCCVPFLRVYSLFATYTFIFGVSIAIFVSLRSIIMVELMGLEKLTNAFGLVIMCQGISSFVGAPIAGMLSDITGDYNISFYVAGVCMGMGGLICFPLRRIARWEEERETRKMEEKLSGQLVKNKSS